MKLVKFTKVTVGRSVGKSASIGYNGAVNISSELAKELAWKEGSRISIFIDEEQETAGQELFVYVTPDKDGLLKLGTSKHGAMRVNLNSLLKEHLPKFETGRLMHKIEKIDKVEYLRLIINYGEPKRRVVSPRKGAVPHVTIAGKPPVAASTVEKKTRRPYTRRNATA